MIVFSIRIALAFALLFYKIFTIIYKFLDLNFNLLTIHQKMKLKLYWV